MIKSKKDASDISTSLNFTFTEDILHAAMVFSNQRFL